MAKLRVHQHSFSQGELSPLLDGRNDLEKLYNQGASKLENFIVYPHGGVTKRPGTRYIATCGVTASGVKLVPFEYSEDEAYILEFGNYYIRFYTDGGIVTSSGTTVYEIASPYSSAEVANIKWVQSADTYYIAHPDMNPHKLVRNGPADWTISDVDFVNGPFLDENEDEDITITPSAVSGTVTLTASSALFNVGHIGGLWKLSSNEVVTKTITSDDDFTSVIEVLEGETMNSVVRGLTVSGTSLNTVVSTQKSYDYGVTWHDIDITATDKILLGIEETNENGGWYRIGIKAGDYDSGTIVVTLENLKSWGYVKITDYANSTLVSGTVERQLPSTSATDKWSEGAWSDYRGWPSAVAFYESRLIFAGSEYRPQTIWGSRVNSYENFRTGSIDDDAYTYSLVSNSLNKIQWLIESGVLHAGTLGGEWKFGYSDTPTTPTTVDAKNQTSDGSANIIPLTINHNVLFIQKGGRALRAKSRIDSVTDLWKSDDISLKSEHLLKDVITQIAFQSAPIPIIWMVRTDGVLVGVTYSPTQSVVAFHEHTTQGEFESIAVIPGDDRDEVWAVVKRNINGSDTRYVEQFQTTDWTDHEDAYYVDCGIEYEGVAKTTLSGAGFLESEEIAILSSGAVLPGTTVSGGSFTMTVSGTRVIAGLPYTAKAQTLYYSPTLQYGSSLGMPISLRDVYVQMYKTLGLEVGSGDDDMMEIIPFRSSAVPMGDAPDLFTGIKMVDYPVGFENNQRIMVQSTQPLPCTILSLATMIESNTF